MEPLSFLKDFCINLVPATSSRYVCVVGVYVLYVHCVLSVCVCSVYVCVAGGRAELGRGVCRRGEII